MRKRNKKLKIEKKKQNKMDYLEIVYYLSILLGFNRRFP